MLELPHTVVGASIAYKTGNPWVALPAAFFSHFILDEMPHWNPHLGSKAKKFKLPLSKNTKIIIADSTLALLTGTLLASTRLPNYKGFVVIMLGAFFAVLPDVIEAPFFFMNFDRIWIKKWLSFQRKHQNNTNIYWGVATQILVVGASLLWIFS